jgi:hypothetical protein
MRRVMFAIDPGNMTRIRSAAMPRCTRSALVLSLIASNGDADRTTAEAFGEPHGRGQRRGQLLERRPAEQMRHQPHESRTVRQVGVYSGTLLMSSTSTSKARSDEVPMPVARGRETESSAACPRDAPRCHRAWRAADTPASRHRAAPPRAPAAARRPKISCRWISALAASGFSRHCQLTTRCAAVPRPWLRRCSPRRRHRHRRPSRRAYASSTPFTKRALREVP